jgi:hypothetical protein
MSESSGIRCEGGGGSAPPTAEDVERFWPHMQRVLWIDDLKFLGLIFLASFTSALLDDLGFWSWIGSLLR